MIIADENVSQDLITFLLIRTMQSILLENTIKV